MPIPRMVRQWNKAGLNRVTRRIAPWMPGFGVVVHRGRRSGRLYQTPVNVFVIEDGYVLALTYGPDTDWVKNVLAAGGSSGWSRRACFTTRPGAASVRWSGRYCGLSASLTSCPLRPHQQPRR